MDETATSYVVEGRVQGVGFRYWAQRQARQLDVAGWVRNRPDGSVELVVQGPSRAVESMFDSLWHGPRLANVSGVQSAPIAIDPDLTGFAILG